MLLPAAPARADDPDRALQQVSPAAPAAPRGSPVLALDWALALRPPDRLHSPLPRPVDLALANAARSGQDAQVRRLLQAGANIEWRGEDGFTPLGAAAFFGHRSTVRLLLRAGADALRWGATGQTAMHLAALTGQLGVLTELLHAGVPIDVLNSQRESALDVAGAANQAAAMDLLIQGGADLPMAGRR